MALDEETIGQAGEYALGTLGADERREAEQRIARDPAYAKAVAEWEARLAPLASAMAIEPPAHLRQRVIEHASRAAQSDLVQLRRHLMLWQGASIGFAALAAVLAALLLIPAAEIADGGHYVAVLQDKGPGPAFVASIDIAAGTVSVRRVGADPQTGKSYELWAIGGGRDRPQSLGVIEASLKVPAGTYGTLLPDTVLAVSLEPAGGSPTGQPTGPVLFTGRLVHTD